MALLETGMAPGQQILKPTDPAKLFRQRGATTSTPVTMKTQAPVATPAIAPVVATTPTPTVQPTVRAAAPSTATPKLSTPASAVSTAPGVAYKYESPQGQKGVLDKNYYEDLGFSTSKAKAEEIRTTLGDIKADVDTTRGNIQDYEGRISEARTKLDESVDNAWKNVATAKVKLGPKTWNVPPETAEAIHESISQTFRPIKTHDARGLTLQQYTKKYRNELMEETSAIAERWPTAAIRGKLTIDANWEPIEGGVTELTEEEIADRNEGMARDLFASQAAYSYRYSKQEGPGVYTYVYDGGEKKDRLKYHSVNAQLSPQISKMELNYKKEYAKAAGVEYEKLNAAQVEAREAEGVLQSQEAEVASNVDAVKEQQATRREGIAETFNSLFRQRSK